MTTDDRGGAPDHLGPLHHLVDLFVCAPLGFVLDAPSLLPRWIDRGREQLASLGDVGRIVSGRGSSEDTASRAGKQAHATLRGLGLAPEPTGDERDDAGDGAGAPASAAGRTVERPTIVPPVAAVPTPVGPDVDTLAITDYDSLSASQVVPRLEGLAPDELESIRAYETANRGRKTILSKIAQLQAP